ncbi:MAG: hypothetical protein HS101_10565 [Planctomycetia bacterium]|nr:hypothetical protein [Planctomycetia bacterium]
MVKHSERGVLLVRQIDLRLVDILHADRLAARLDRVQLVLKPIARRAVKQERAHQQEQKEAENRRQLRMPAHPSSKPLTPLSPGVIHHEYSVLA